MAEDRYYFDHDYSARNDDKILELRGEYGAEGYGAFWMLLETMAENRNGGIKASLMGGLSLGFGLPKAKLLAIVEFCIKIDLFYEENEGEKIFFSHRMNSHKKFRKSLSDAGKKGADKRWKNAPPNSPPNAKQNITKQISNNNAPVEDSETIGIEIVKKAAREAWDNQSWREQCCIGHKLTESELKQWMAQFNSSLCNDNVPNFTNGAYRKMFNGWLNKQKEKGYKLPEKEKSSTPKLTTLS